MSDYGLNMSKYENILLGVLFWAFFFFFLKANHCRLRHTSVNEHTQDN